ncbi:unnamed protein product [Soboliphyme baturini]|uniref:C2H2-type domain-containing protein n=1 Tax=Soboliphyme baturini TaxID=241478 RepID=A0A183IZS2_9BILA|nr:unnamed protein product [Soboliphyme baturini]
MKSRTSRFQPKRSLGTACFSCGLYFQHRPHYKQHMAMMHNFREPLGSYVCPECGQLFNDDFELVEHYLMHDLVLLVEALNKFVTRRKTTSTDVNKQKPLGFGTSSTSSVSKRKKSRTIPPVSRVRKITNGSERKSSGSGLKLKLAFSAKSRQSKSFGVISKPTPKKIDFGSKEKAKQGSSRKITLAVEKNTDLAPAPESEKTKYSPFFLRAKCEKCKESWGKPYNLINHLICDHNANIFHLQREVMTEVSQVTEVLSGKTCKFCEAKFFDTSSCMIHVVRSHRAKVFECPSDGRQCSVCFELCSHNEGGVDKRFKISVNVKPSNQARSEDPV